ncbi:MAG: NnrU family protein [Caulobacterales bacterium]
MTSLVAAAAVFLMIHLLVSGTRVRDALTGAIGQGPYMGLFSLASLACLVWLGYAYGHAGAAATYWSATDVSKIAQLVIQFVAVQFVVIGLATPNPTSVRQEATLDKADAVRGMLRVTRHPFLWGAALWAAGHLIVRGDAPSLVLFGTILVLGVAGTFSIDAKRKRVLAAKWDAFAAQTSNIPFAAIVQGRQKLNLGEIGWWRIAIAVAVWVAIVAGHKLAFGVSPLPGR